MPVRTALRLLLGFVASVIVVALPKAASAQTVSIVASESLPRLDRSGSAVVKRTSGQQPEAISFRDCLDDQRIRVPLLLSGFQANGILEAWASLPGADCASPSARSGPTAACWRLASAPLAPSSTVDLPVRAILAGAAPANRGDSADERAACARVDRTTLELQFLYLSPGQPSNAAASARVELRVDTIGNPAVGDLSVLPGNERLVARWSPLPEPWISAAVNVYCAPISVPDAGACPSPFVAGTFPDAELDARFRCGTVVGEGTSAVASTLHGAPLTNGVSYAVAVASIDELGNVGALSAPVCVAPDAAAPDDQSGGSSSCSVRRGPRGRDGLVGLAALAVAALVTASRRRSTATRGARRRADMA